MKIRNVKNISPISFILNQLQSSEIFIKPKLAIKNKAAEQRNILVFSNILLKLLIFICILFHSFSSYADSIPHTPKKYIASFFTDTKDLLLFPQQWNTNQWITAGVLTASTGAMIFFDDDIQQWSQKNRNTSLDDVSKFAAEPWGTPKFHRNYSLITAAGIFTYGLIAKDSKAKHCAFSGVKAFALTGALTYIPKSVFGRQRPNVTDGPDHLDWRGPFKGESFFSGHTSVSFAFASVVAEYYKETKWIPVVSYTFAAMCGLSRIYDNKHWASDVLAGAAFGIAVGKLVARNDQEIFLSYHPVLNAPLLTFHHRF